MERIVVGVDESPAAAHALRWAVAEGRIRRWPVTATLCWTFAGQHGPGGPSRFRLDVDAEDVDVALDEIVEKAVGPDHARTVARRQVADFPVPGLLAQVSVGDLLVVGAGGVGTRRGLLMGSVSQDVVHRAPCPVAVVRAPEGSCDELPTTGGPVLVGIDGSAPARRALLWALDEGRRRGAPVEVVHAWDLPTMSAYLPTEGYDVDRFGRDARRVLASALDEVAGAAVGVTVHPHLVRGRAGDALLERAASADLVVVGSKGLGAVAGLVIGSVAHHVSHLVRRPVVLVPDIDAVL